MDFLEMLYSKTEMRFSDLLNQAGDVHNLVSLYELIHRNSTLLIDLDDETLEHITDENSDAFNPIIAGLLQDETCEFYNAPEVFEQMKTEEAFFKSLNFPQALFFLSSSPEVCHQLCEDYGYIFISKDEIDEKIPFLFNFDIQNIVSNQQPNSWRFLENYKHPFNSMIIADNHILNNPKSYQENLFALMRNLMPQKLNNEVFHLTIIISVGKDARTTFSTEIRQQQWEIINDFLEKEFDYKINLTILQASGLHDRNILTNYIWISSPYGLELFNNGNVLINRQTQIKMFPMTYLKRDFKNFFDTNTESDLKNTILETFEYLRNQSKDINTKTVDILETINVYGNKINRLLE